MISYLFIYFIDLSQKSLHNYTFQIDARTNRSKGYHQIEQIDQIDGQGFFEYQSRCPVLLAKFSLVHIVISTQ